MTDNLYRDIIDALVDVYEGLPLAAHNVVKYRRPVVTMPEDCPLLTVFVLSEDIQPRTTVGMDTMIAVGVTWQEAAVDSAQTLKENPERSVSLLNAMQQLKRATWDLNKQVEEWVIPGAYEVQPMSVAYSEPRTYQSLDTGLVEGYSLTVRVTVEEGV